VAFWGLLGPFAEGSFLRRLMLHVSGDAAFAMSIGAVLGPSGEASEVAFRAGKTLIDRSTDYYFGAPVLRVDVVAGTSPRYVLTPGVKIHSGSRYCVVMFATSAGPARVTLCATAEVLESVPGD